MSDARHESKTRLLDAAMQVIRSRGYTATRLEDVCEVAGLTKGSFFHHFKGKEDLALATIAYWNEVTEGAFAAAPHRGLADPVDRLLGYVNLRKAMLRGELPDFTCLIGTMVQEVYDTHPAIRDAGERSLAAHAAVLEADIAEALAARGVETGGSAGGLARHMIAVIQGSFILAKARREPGVVGESLDHLDRYLRLVFHRPEAPGAVQ